MPPWRPRVFLPMLMLTAAALLGPPACDDDRLTKPPRPADSGAAVPAAGATGISAAVGSSDQAQVVAYGSRVRVTVPAGALTEPSTLRIADCPNPPQPFSPAYEPLAAYDVSIQEPGVLSGEIAIEMAVDVSRIRDDVPETIAVVAACYDAAVEEWITVPCTLDRQAGTVTLRTRHLCPAAVYHIGRRYTHTNCGSFLAYYDPSEIHRGVSWIHSSGQRQPQGLRKDVNGQDVPPYVDDVCTSVQRALVAYAGELGQSPKSSPLYVFVTGVGSPSHRGQISGYIVFITTNCAYEVQRGQQVVATVHDSLQYAVAHEVFHNVQLSRFSDAQSESHRWWMEITAEWAGSKVACRTPFADMGKLEELASEPQSMLHFLDCPLTYAPPTSLQETRPRKLHSYHAVYFLDYLIRAAVAARTAQGIGDTEIGVFRALYDGVIADGGGGSNDVTLLASLERIRQTMRVPHDLPEVFDLFAAWYLLHAESPLAIRFGGAIPADCLAQAEELRSADGPRRFHFELGRNHTAKAWALRAVVPQRHQQLVLRCSLAEPLRIQAHVWTLVLPGNRRITGDFLREIWRRHDVVLADHPVTVRLADGDVLYVLAMNHEQTPASPPARETPEVIDTVSVEVCPQPADHYWGYWILRQSEADARRAYEDQPEGSTTFITTHENTGPHRSSGTQRAAGETSTDAGAGRYTYDQTGTIAWPSPPRVLPVESSWTLAAEASVETRCEPDTGDVRATLASLRANQEIPTLGTHAPPTRCTFDAVWYSDTATSLERNGLAPGPASTLGTSPALLRFAEGTSRQSLTVPFTPRYCKPGTTLSEERFVLLVRASTPGGSTREAFVYEFQPALPPDLQAEFDRAVNDRAFVPPPEPDFAAGQVATPDRPTSEPVAADQTTLGDLRHLPTELVPMEEARFQVEVANPPADAVYEWRMGEPSMNGRPVAWTDVPALRYSYGQAGTHTVSVRVRSRASYSRVLAERDWQVKVGVGPE